MLQSEIIYNIKNVISGGVQSDDLSISDNQIAFMVDYYRAKLFKQREDRGAFKKEQYVQNLGNISFKLIDKNEQCNIHDCILRSEFKIPRPILLTFVGLTNGVPFQRTDHNAIVWQVSDKFTSKQPKWYFQNGYIYLVNPPTKHIEILNIQGVFESPSLVDKFNKNKCEDEVCSNSLSGYDFEYPLPMHYNDSIVKMVLDVELKILVSLPSDITNESIDRINLSGN